jgi:uncharacterized membrane protein
MKDETADLYFMKKHTRDIVFTALVAVLIIFLFFVRTGFEPDKDPGEIRARAKVLSVDNTDMNQFGIVKTGQQTLTLEIVTSEYKGSIKKADNFLTGKMELDKVFSKGDSVYVVLETKNGEIRFVNVIDHYRLGVELVLLLIFLLFLVFFAGWTGIKAIMSFLFTALCIWKILLPGFLKGYNPVFLSLAVVSTLTFIIIFLVGGLTKKGLTAFLGAMAGIILTCILSIIFGRFFKIHGAVKPFSEALLYSGYPHLDLGGIFLSGIFIAASGAVMDIAMDIASSQKEVFDKHPGIKRKEIIASGFSVGKAVIGTMTTTLLLAYSGSFTALFMIFIAQKIPVMNFFNITYVASEILHTLVGSFGLVTVAPFTAIIGGFIFVRKTEPGGN